MSAVLRDQRQLALPEHGDLQRSLQHQSSCGPVPVPVSKDTDTQQPPIPVARGTERVIVQD